MNIKFDDDQKKAISVKNNAVVSAGAGSGKTTVLAERFCYLIESGLADIDGILALTFTQKAKTEMYEKIYERLRASKEPRAAQAISRIDDAAISTLDSFCSEIARNWASHFGISPNFEYADSCELAQRASLDFMLDKSDHPALKKFIHINGFDSVLNGFFADFAVSHVRIGKETDYTKYYPLQIEHLSAELDRRLLELCASLDEITQLPGEKDSVKNKQKMIECLPDLRSLAREGEYVEFIAALSAINTVKPGGAAGETVTLMKDLLDRVKAEIAALASIATTLIEEDLVAELFSMLGEFAEFYIAKKRSTGSLDYSDVAQIALVTLSENRSVRQYYKQKFDYVIIDEFQDNNSLQKNMLYFLAEKRDLFSADVPLPSDLEPGKLFFVGDEKQSIYGFRGADVSVFKLLGSELIAAGGQALELRTNYRSETALIDFFNGFFASLMQGAEADYEARFSGLLACRKEKRIESAITFLYKPFSENEAGDGFSSDESEAFAIASYLSDSIRGGKLEIIKDGSTARADFDDCAVLMRSTSNQTIYERMFRLFDIPFITQGARSLFLEAPIYDLYFLLRSACFPDDRVAYAGFLRSPLVNLSDSALIRILESSPEPFAELENLEADDKVKYEAGRRIKDYVARNADKLPLSRLVDYFWYECGYRLTVLRDGRYPNLLEYYDYIVTIARSFDKDGRTISEFLDFVYENLGKYEKLEDADILKLDQKGVKLLTIHKSKGLEFPVVILANTGNMGRHSGFEGSRPYYMTEKFGPTFHVGESNYFYALGKEEADKEHIAELKRLLYVALTRAESHLVVSGSHNRQNRTSLRTHLNMVIRCLGLTGEVEEGIYTTSNGSKVEIKIIGDLTREEYMKRAKRFSPIDVSGIAPMYEESALVEFSYPKIEFRVTELSEIYGSRAKPGRLTDQPGLAIDGLLEKEKLEALFGTLCHAILDFRIRKGECSKDDILRAMGREIPEAEFDTLFESAYALSESFFSSEFYGAMKAAGKIETEYPFIYMLEAEKEKYYIQGVVDLYWETEEEGFIIDFKTDARVDAVKYGFQLAMYRLALEECFGKKISCIIFPLRSGNSIAVEERISDSDLIELIKAARSV